MLLTQTQRVVHVSRGSTCDKRGAYAGRHSAKHLQQDQKREEGSSAVFELRLCSGSAPVRLCGLALESLDQQQAWVFCARYCRQASYDYTQRRQELFLIGACGLTSVRTAPDCVIISAISKRTMGHSRDAVSRKTRIRIRMPIASSARP